MSVRTFCDEVKDSGFLPAAAVLLPGDLSAARKTIRSLVKPGQKHLHFHKERDQRRAQILDVIVELRPKVLLDDASLLPRRRQRDECLERLLDDLAARRAQWLTLDHDESVVEVDRKLLYRRVRDAELPT